MSNNNNNNNNVSTFFNFAFINFVKTAKQIRADIRERLLSSLDFLKNNKIFLLFEKSDAKYIVLLKTNLDKEVGDFAISTHTSGLLMNIYIDDEYMNGCLRKQGLSRLLIAAMIFQMEATHPFRCDQLFFIDVDASYENGRSFWEHIGMNLCRFDEVHRSGIRKLSLTGSGNEKVITYSDLSRWSLGVPSGNNQIVTRQF